jgi:hypothetical protein
MAKAACETYLRTSESASYLFSFVSVGTKDEAAGMFNHYGRAHTIQFHITRTTSATALELTHLEILRNGAWTEVPFTYKVTPSAHRPIDHVKLSAIDFMSTMGPVKIIFELWYNRPSPENGSTWTLKDIAIKDIVEADRI